MKSVIIGNMDISDIEGEVRFSLDSDISHFNEQIFNILDCDNLYISGKLSHQGIIKYLIAKEFKKTIIIRENVVLSTIKSIIQELMGIEDITINCRKKKFIFARIIFAKLARENGETLQSIAQSLNLSHSSIINYLEEYADLVEFDEEFKYWNYSIRKQLKYYKDNKMYKEEEYKAFFQMRELKYLEEKIRSERRHAGDKESVVYCDERISAIQECMDILQKNCRLSLS